MSDLQAIRAFIFDVDGVLTEGQIFYTNDGNELKAFNIQDGWAIVEAKKQGFITAIITGRRSFVVEKRAKELKIDFLEQGALAKREAYETFKKQYALHDNEIAYIGDDVIDLPILVRCGWSVCPSDANEEIKKRVDYISGFNGGRGAVREMIELVLKKQNRWDKIVERYIVQ